MATRWYAPDIGFVVKYRRDVELGSGVSGAWTATKIVSPNIDRTFHVIKVHRVNRPVGDYEAINYFKAVKYGPYLMVCGGYTGNMTARTSITYHDALMNHDSYLLVGTRDDPAAPRISPLAFLAANLPASPRLEDISSPTTTGNRNTGVADFGSQRQMDADTDAGRG